MKFKMKWAPNLVQDLDVLTTKGTLGYDEELTKQLINEYGSIENFKQSEKFKKMNHEFESQ